MEGELLYMQKVREETGFNYLEEMICTLRKVGRKT